MYEKYILGMAHTWRHVYVRAHTSASAGSSGRYHGGRFSRQENRTILEPIVLMGFLSGTPALICIQPHAAHPRNSFLGKDIMTPREHSIVMAMVRMAYLRSTKTVRGRRGTIGTKSCHTLRVRWSNNASPLEAGQMSIHRFLILILICAAVRCFVRCFVALLYVQREMPPL